MFICQNSKITTNHGIRHFVPIKVVTIHDGKSNN